MHGRHQEYDRGRRATARRDRHADHIPEHGGPVTGNGYTSNRRRTPNDITFRDSEGSIMGDYRGDHYGAAENAIQVIGEMQELLAVLTERADTAIGAVLSAIGSTEVESARNAMNFTAETKNRVQEIFAILDQAVAELRRYQGGF